MRKAMVVLAAVVFATLGLVGTADAQDSVIGTVTADPSSVPSAGEYTFTATGADFIPDSSVLLTSCVAPGDPFVPGVTTVEEITDRAGLINPLADCDLGNAVSIDVDSNGAWSASVTATVGDNFMLSAGALDGSQAGATWVPIVGDSAAATDDSADDSADDNGDDNGDDAAAEDTADEDLAETGVETGLLAVIGTAALAAGVIVRREGRRLER